jgi:hypothetical protein
MRSVPPCSLCHIQRRGAVTRDKMAFATMVSIVVCASRLGSASCGSCSLHHFFLRLPPGRRNWTTRACYFPASHCFHLFSRMVCLRFVEAGGHPLPRVQAVGNGRQREQIQKWQTAPRR